MRSARRSAGQIASNDGSCGPAAAAVRATPIDGLLTDGRLDRRRRRARAGRTPAALAGIGIGGGSGGAGGAGGAPKPGMRGRGAGGGGGGISSIGSKLGIGS